MENKTLWDKLNPEIKEKLNKDRKKYPDSISNLIYELKQLKYVHDMTYLTVKAICMYGGVDLDYMYSAFKTTLQAKISFHE